MARDWGLPSDLCVLLGLRNSTTWRAQRHGGRVGQGGVSVIASISEPEMASSAAGQAQGLQKEGTPDFFFFFLMFSDSQKTMTSLPDYSQRPVTLSVN